ncbi:MAG TPA: Sec-independent protein translocase protein TatB [Moraxellaceae bacterium]|nr:Sec-independent protein translocase protein TatB [Moraxellaceae bacterium]
MFDVGFSELLLLAIVALVVLGPEKLPHAARIAGAWVGRIRRTVTSMQAEIEREVAAQEVRQQFEKQFRDLGGQDFVKELEAERRDIEQAISDTAAEAAAPVGGVATPAASHGIPLVAPVVIETSSAAALPGAVDQADPVLPQAATPPDEVALDGEAAYREWLAAQRRENRIAPPAPAHKDSSA